MKTFIADMHAPHTDTVSGWMARRKETGSAARTGFGVAREYAKQNGVAIVMMADDSAMMYYRSATDAETSPVRQRHYKASETRWTSSRHAT